MIRIFRIFVLVDRIIFLVKRTRKWRPLLGVEVITLYLDKKRAPRNTVGGG